MCDVTIKSADKGSAAVVMNTSDYVKEGLQEFPDSKFYKKLTFDITTDHQHQVVEAVNNMFFLNKI